MTTKTKVITFTVIAASLTTDTAILQDLTDADSTPVEVELNQLSDEAQTALLLTEEKPLLNGQAVLVTVTPEGMDGETMLYSLLEAKEVKAISKHAPTSSMREKNVW